MSASGCQHDNMITEDAVMSDTPRTEAARAAFIARTYTGECSCVDAEDMAKLERELSKEKEYAAILELQRVDDKAELSAYRQAEKELPEEPLHLTISRKLKLDAVANVIAAYDDLRARAVALKAELVAATERAEKAEQELVKREGCSFIGPMRDCPTHGESQRLKDAERRAEENARDAERYRWLRKHEYRT